MYTLRFVFVTEQDSSLCVYQSLIHLSLPQRTQHFIENPTEAVVILNSSRYSYSGIQAASLRCVDLSETKRGQAGGSVGGSVQLRPSESCQRPSHCWGCFLSRPITVVFVSGFHTCAQEGPLCPPAKKTINKKRFPPSLSLHLGFYAL